MAPRIVRRQRTRAPMALTAASTPVRDPATTFRSKSLMVSGQDDWQREAWEFLDEVGELRYYTEWVSASVGRCRLVASDVDDNGDPTGTTETQVVSQVVRDIGEGITGQSQLLSRTAVLLTVPGEGYLAMVVRREDEKNLADESVIGMEQWLVLSRDEIERDGRGKVMLSMPDGAKHEFDSDTDLLFRVWNQHPHKASDADSPVRAARKPLREIRAATTRIDNAARSRAVGNGILFLPDELSLPGLRPTDEDGEPAPANATAQDLQDQIFEVATTAVKDPDSMAAFVPLMAQVSGEYADKVKHIKWDSEVSSTALTTRDSAIRRLALSLNTSPERLLGMSTGNHWTSWLIDETDVKVHIAPILETICAALTRAVLRPVLTRAGLDPAKYAIWYDASPLTQDPDRTDEATAAYDRGAITADAYRRYMGFEEADGYDLTGLPGWRALAADRAARDVTLIPMLAPLLDPGLADIDATALPSSRPSAAEPPASEESEPAEPVSVAAARAVVALCLTRALTLANKRRRTRSDMASLRDVPAHEAHTVLGPVGVEEAREHLAGWRAEVPEHDLARAGLDPAGAMALVDTVAVEALTRAAPPRLTEDQVREVLT